jgi:hypothetical protein
MKFCIWAWNFKASYETALFTFYELAGYEISSTSAKLCISTNYILWNLILGYNYYEILSMSAKLHQVLWKFIPGYKTTSTVMKFHTWVQSYIDCYEISYLGTNYINYYEISYLGTKYNYYECLFPGTKLHQLYECLFLGTKLHQLLWNFTPGYKTTSMCMKLPTTVQNLWESNIWKN